jgi:hypothetical protein
MVSRELKGLSMKLKNARFGPLFRSYGDQRNYFHLKAMRAAQKTSSNIFLKKIKKNYTMLDRSIPKGKLWFILSGSAPWRRCLCRTGLMEHRGPWKCEKS